MYDEDFFYEQQERMRQQMQEQYDAQQQNILEGQYRRGHEDGMFQERQYMAERGVGGDRSMYAETRIPMSIPVAFIGFVLLFIVVCIVAFGKAVF